MNSSRKESQIENLTDTLMTLRLRPTTKPNRNMIEEFNSDHSRIIYSSSFRLLQQKTQVFPLDLNKSVRTRLTHSIEVADLGNSLGIQICVLEDPKDKSEQYEDPLAYQRAINNHLVLTDCISRVVSNACLIHDIGNPPFGHFGETAIRDWFKKNYKTLLSIANVELKNKNLMNDFLKFDGNPQGIRILNRSLSDGLAGQMNLTVSTLLSMIKYPSLPNLKNNKSGFFYSEKELIEDYYKVFGLKKENSESSKIAYRFPLSYFVEAADDIAYCLSDIADGIEKGLLTQIDFVHLFKGKWHDLYNCEIPLEYAKTIEDENKYSYKLDVSVKWSNSMMKEVVEAAKEHKNEIFEGKADDLISYTDSTKKVLDALKSIARDKLYRADEVERLELSGLKVINSLLDNFGKLLRLSKEKFFLLVNGESPAGKDLDIEWRIFNRIGSAAIDTYRFGIITQGDLGREQLYWKSYYKWDDTSRFEQFKSDYKSIDEELEWFYRAHMIVDYISGMTDDFALDLYKVFNGVQII